MENSYRFFKNIDCDFYPCHQGIEELNCLFCYCPMYRFEKCLGNPEFRERNGKPLKICTNCTFPHEADHYDQIMQFLINDGVVEK